MAHNYKVGDRVRITGAGHWREGEIGTVIEVEPSTYTGSMPVLVQFSDEGEVWPQYIDFEVVSAMPETRYIRAAATVLGMDAGITAEDVTKVLDLARKFEEAAK